MSSKRPPEPQFRRRPARRIVFNPQLPSTMWPEGARLQGGNSYAFYYRGKMQLIEAGDVVVYEGLEVTVMSSSEFENTFEEV